MAEDKSEQMTSLRYYPLDDKIAEKAYDDWRYKTMSQIKKKGWSLPFDEPTRVVPSKEDMAGEKITDTMKEMYKSNMEVYDQLVIACDGIPFGLVKRAEGDARKAFKFLDQKYARNSEEDLAEVLSEFSRCKLASKQEDPDKWFMEMDRLNNRLRTIGKEYTKKGFEMKAHYLGGLPEGYEDVLTKLSGKVSEYDVYEIENEIRNKWKRDFKKSAEEPEKEKNHALNVEKKKKGGFNKKFKGLCRNCGKQGHKSAECKSDKKTTCFNCGKEGHYARDCPDKANDKGKDQTKEKDMGMFVGMCYEVGTFVGSVENKERFLLDSGATCHVVVDETMLSEVSAVKEALVVGDGK